MAFLLVLAVLAALCFTLDAVFGTKLFSRPSRSYGAKAIFGQGVDQIIGSIGNTVFQRWKSGVTSIRKKSSAIHNAHSTVQSAIRAGMAYFSAYWNSTLTAQQRTDWNTYAAGKPWAGPNTGGVNELIKHNNGIYSGFNAFCMVNQNAARIGLGPITAAPLGLTPPTPPLAVGVSCAAGTATVVWTTPVTAKAGALCEIWARVEGVPGIHVQVNSAPAYDAETGDITAIRGANGQNVLLTSLVGKRLWVQLDTVDTDGTRSSRSNSASCVIA